jgi:hypothetical protein
MENKLGHQAPKGRRVNLFNYVGISNSDLKFCDSHNFVFDSEVEDIVTFLTQTTKNLNAPEI